MYPDYPVLYRTTHQTFGGTGSPIPRRRIVPGAPSYHFGPKQVTPVILLSLQHLPLYRLHLWRAVRSVSVSPQCPILLVYGKFGRVELFFFFSNQVGPSPQVGGRRARLRQCTVCPGAEGPAPVPDRPPGHTPGAQDPSGHVGGSRPRCPSPTRASGGDSPTDWPAPQGPPPTGGVRSHRRGGRGLRRDSILDANLSPVSSRRHGCGRRARARRTNARDRHSARTRFGAKLEFFGPQSTVGQRRATPVTSILPRDADPWVQGSRTRDLAWTRPKCLGLRRGTAPDWFNPPLPPLFVIVQ